MYPRRIGRSDNRVMGKAMKGKMLEGAGDDDSYSTYTTAGEHKPDLQRGHLFARATEHGHA
jgi:hypothetical protein